LELEKIASEFQRPAFEAAALSARGQVAMMEGDAEDAIQSFDRAWRLWRGIGFPYEEARARMLLGQARAAAGEDNAARMELGAARSSFVKLGAALDLKRVDELLYLSRAPEESRSRVAKILMFTDIVNSTDLVGLMGDEAWEGLLRWHDDQVRGIVASHRGEVVSHTGDGFFATFEQAANALEATVAIQRRLAQHRQEHGFSPMIRIGLHLAEVTQDGADYRGQGVHVAARIAAVARGGEIVISHAVLETLDDPVFSISESHAVELKGIKDPIDVHHVDWR
jgi:class 3 adenylate cyclase